MIQEIRMDSSFVSVYWTSYVDRRIQLSVFIKAVNHFSLFAYIFTDYLVLVSRLSDLYFSLCFLDTGGVAAVLMRSSEDGPKTLGINCGVNTALPLHRRFLDIYFGFKFSH